MMFCHECGNEMRVDETGVSNHLTGDGGIDYEQDADHVALADDAMPLVPRKRPQSVTLCDVCGRDHDGETHRDFVDSYCEEG